MFITLFLLALPLLVSSDCVVEWDSENVVATQLEGSWALNQEVSNDLYPYEADNINIAEIK